MARFVWRESAECFRELPFGCNRSPTVGLVPRNGDVDEALEKVALLGRRGAPGGFELFVCLEVLAGSDQLEPCFKL